MGTYYRIIKKEISILKNVQTHQKLEWNMKRKESKGHINEI